jgi:magnesium and cobalt transporter
LGETESRDNKLLLNWLKRKLGLHRRPRELKEVLDVGEEQGLFDEEQGDMIEGIFDLKQTVAREIMIPRTHMVCLPRDADKERTLTTIIESGHSRIPIYSDTVDQIVGILYAKDLLPLWLKNVETFNLEEIAREPFFVPETNRIKDLLDDLRNRKSHLAVIVDEYGGVSGIVTIEDIVEEIIGDISDEHDAEEEIFSPQEDGSVVVSAMANVDEFEEYFGVTLPRAGYDTLGGFIINVMGKVPARGEETVHEGLRIQVAGCDPTRITRLIVRRTAPEAASLETSPNTAA